MLISPVSRSRPHTDAVCADRYTGVLSWHSQNEMIHRTAQYSISISDLLLFWAFLCFYLHRNTSLFPSQVPMNTRRLSFLDGILFTARTVRARGWQHSVALYFTTVVIMTSFSFLPWYQITYQESWNFTGIDYYISGIGTYLEVTKLS